MRQSRSVETVRAAMATALGLLPVFSGFCGGHTTTSSPADGSIGDTTTDRAGTDASGTDETRIPPVTADGGGVDAVLPDSFPADAVTPMEAGSAFPCVDATPLVIGGKNTGYDTCRGGTLRRRTIMDCPNLLPRPSAGACPPPDSGLLSLIDAGLLIECRADTDCDAQPYGTCFEGPQVLCACQYGCVRDSDCRANEICVCADPVGSCAPASCNAGTCAANFECAAYATNPGCPGNAFACQTASDSCFSDSDCDAGAMCSIGHDAAAGFNVPSAGTRVCSPQNCVVGRPFLVAGQSRLPGVRSRDDWRAREVMPAVHTLSSEARAHLAERWRDLARMEHASIAAFARFALQLLSVGAPAHLVLAAQQAMGDETRHALFCYALASAYAARDLGPGPLEVDACLDKTDISALVAAVFAEGCIGETVAAIEAQEALEYAHDPAVRAVLETIAADETRHAQLAWRTVEWAISEGGARLRDVVATEIARELRAHARCTSSACPEDDPWLEHGILGESRRRRLRSAAIEEVILPALRHLLARRAVQRDAVA